jgi:hypothetical protein
MNMNSWSKLASLSQTPSSLGAAKKTSTMQSFEQFRRQAKEKEERVSFAPSSPSPSLSLCIFVNFVNAL